jgi:hypothetical protein
MTRRIAEFSKLVADASKKSHLGARTVNYRAAHDLTAIDTRETQ